MDWTLEHELALQEKLNGYLSFVESGEIYTRFPKAKGKRIEIRVMFEHKPDTKGKAFLDKVKGAIEGAGFRFSYQVGIPRLAPDRMN